MKKLMMSLLLSISMIIASVSVAINDVCALNNPNKEYTFFENATPGSALLFDGKSTMLVIALSVSFLALAASYALCKDRRNGPADRNEIIKRLK